MLKKMFSFIGWFFIWLLGGTFLLTTFNYFDLISDNIISIVRFMLPILIIFIYSYRLGKSSDKKGYLEGLKFGSMIILSFVFIVILLDNLNLKCIFYYLIMLLTSIMGSTIGINRKKNNT